MDKDIVSLEKILEYIEKIEVYSNVSEDEFFEDEKSLHATVFCLA